MTARPAPRSLDLPDQRIVFADRPGTPGSDADPIVLLHGGGVDARMWGPQLRDDALAGRRLLAPDARGHGGSSDAADDYRLCDDVVALLDALEIERAVLFGLSMGGGTAVDVALEHPSRVRALVVSGTGTSEPRFTDPWTLEVLRAWARTQAAGDAEGWIEAFLRFTHGPSRSRGDVDPEVWDLIDTMVRQTLTHLRLDDAGIPIPPTPPTPVTGTWERLPGIAVPVLAVAGLADGADHVAMSRALAEAVPTGELVEVPGAAHYPTLEEPETVDAAVVDFLARHGA